MKTETEMPTPETLGICNWRSLATMSQGKRHIQFGIEKPRRDDPLDPRKLILEWPYAQFQWRKIDGARGSVIGNCVVTFTPNTEFRLWLQTLRFVLGGGYADAEKADCALTWRGNLPAVGQDAFAFGTSLAFPEGVVSSSDPTVKVKFSGTHGGTAELEFFSEQQAAVELKSPSSLALLELLELLHSKNLCAQ